MVNNSLQYIFIEIISTILHSIISFAILHSAFGLFSDRQPASITKNIYLVNAGMKSNCFGTKNNLVSK